MSSENKVLLNKDKDKSLPLSDRGLPTKKKTKKDKPKVKPESSDSTKSKRFPVNVITSLSDSEEEVKKEKPAKVFDNYKDACNTVFDNYFIS